MGARVLAVAGVLAVLAAAGLLLLPDAAPKIGNGAPPEPVDTLVVPSAGTWALIRVADAPGLCVTEGRDRAGRLRSAVAVRRPCEVPGGSRTFLQPLADGLVHIKWEHPVDRVMGCLTVLDGGQGDGLVEPRDECAPDHDAQLFRFERVDPGAQRYRIRRAGTGLCLGVAEPATAGAEITRSPCPPCRSSTSWSSRRRAGRCPARPAPR